MASTRKTRSMTATGTTASPIKPTALKDFRLGEQKDSDASDSEPDQSARSERSESPEKIEGTRTKSKKKRERRKVGALTDGLDSLLGAAFKGDDGDVSGQDVHANVDADMEVKVEQFGPQKKMNKRTRQNLLKMEQRRQQQLANKQREMMPELVHTTSSPMKTRPLDTKKKATDARRARKERARKERARMARKQGEGERMDLG